MFLADLGVRTLADIRLMRSSGQALLSEFETSKGALDADAAFSISALRTLSMSRAVTTTASQVNQLVQDRESALRTKPPPDNEPGEPLRVLSYRRLIATGGTPETPTMAAASASGPHAREQSNRQAKLDSFFQLLMEDVIDLNPMGATMKQLQDPGSLQSLKGMVLTTASQLSTERISALMAAFRRWKKFAVPKGYPLRQPTALQLAEFLQTVSRGGPTAASSVWQSLQWHKTHLGPDVPLQHWVVALYKLLPSGHETRQTLELEPWELINIVMFAKKQVGTNLIFASFVLQSALSSIRFKHIQRSRPAGEYPVAAIFRCAQGKRRVRGSRPGYSWATPSLEFHGFSLLKILTEFYRHECLTEVFFLWP